MEQQQFLRECGKSYPEVWAALAYFRQLVQRQCETVVQKRIKEFCNVLAVSDKHLELKEYAYPDSPVPARLDHLKCLGWTARPSDNLHIYSYMYWDPKPEEGSTPLGVGIEIWIKNGSKRKQLAAQLDQHCENPAFRNDKRWYCGQNGQSYAFWMEMTESDLPQFEQKLDQNFDRIIGFLKSVKGIASYFKP
jgi:hypothetical protein